MASIVPSSKKRSRQLDFHCRLLVRLTTLFSFLRHFMELENWWGPGWEGEDVLLSKFLELNFDLL